MSNFSYINTCKRHLSAQNTDRDVAKTIILALGSNLMGSWGDPLHTLNQAFCKLETHNLKIIRISSIYETSPIGLPGQANYYNCVLQITTSLSAQSLLHKIKQLEKEAGRKGKTCHWSSRVLDIDIIDYKGLIQNWNINKKCRASHSSQILTLPHAYAHNRAFVLVPLVEICPNWIHPVLRKSATSLIKWNPSHTINKGQILEKIEFTEGI
ncbi:MAG: 2-amino-4-hydroxy-6-hydroxymethyldihydropteridine diphosphokinase [Pseudomonadota bacterium]